MSRNLDLKGGFRFSGNLDTDMISITIPIYNEHGAIEALFAKIKEVMDRLGRPYEVIFVNDGSTDGSAAMLDGLAAKNPEAKVVHFRRNFGQTAAMMAGFDHASGEGFDVCSGWRRDRQDNALQRNIPSMMANKLISGISGVRLHDFGCSLKAYRAEVVKGVRLYGEMHRFLPIYAKWHGARITEIPVNHFARRTGNSKYGLERVLKVILDLVTVKFLDKYMMKPMYLFGFWAFASFASCLLFALWAVYMRGRGYYFTQTPLPMMAVFAFMTGVICVLLGLLAEMITRTFHESQNKSIYLVKGTRNFAAR